MDVLRFATAGSVDDGKSSLIGRLLHDSRSLLEDQVAAVERASRQRGSDSLELALLTDGLRAEREQNITIDVAYRYFSTLRRKFIIADTPGHVQYTRNMVTGVSRADLAVILVDATKGLLPQSKRHTAVSALMEVPHLVAAINKMDLVDYDEPRFAQVAAEFQALAHKLGARHATAIPVSALVGDNVVDRSERMPWYAGPTLLEHLETVDLDHALDDGPFRMFVQTVIRAEGGFRGLTGRPSSGTLRVGDELVVLPGGHTAGVAELRGPDGPIDASQPGMPLTVRLAKDVDASRGALLAPVGHAPPASNHLELVVCWMGEQPVEAGATLLLAHGTRRLAARVERIDAAIDVETLDPYQTSRLSTNDLGRITLTTAEPVYAEPYARREEAGRLLLIDPGTLVTVAAAMVRRAWKDEPSKRSAGRILKVYGGAASAFADQLRGVLPNLVVLDDPALHGLNADQPDASEAARRLRAVAEVVADAGHPVLVLAGTPDATEIDQVTPGLLAEALALLEGR